MLEMAEQEDGRFFAKNTKKRTKYSVMDLKKDSTFSGPHLRFHEFHAPSAVFTYFYNQFSLVFYYDVYVLISIDLLCGYI